MKYGSLIHIQRSLNFSETKFLFNFPNNSLSPFLSFSITSLLTIKSASNRSTRVESFTFVIIEIIRRIKHYCSRETDRTNSTPNNNQKRSQSLKPFEERFSLPLSFSLPSEYLGRRSFNQRFHLTQSHFPPFFAALVPSFFVILCYTRITGREKRERERKRGWHCPLTRFFFLNNLSARIPNSIPQLS